MTNAMAVSPGDVIAGKYRVEKVLGVGGMGAVVAATHMQLGHKVALKFMLPEATGNSDMAARFLREAQAAANLRSEHVTRVSDMGTLPDGALFIVMEHLQGTDLEQLLEERGPLSPKEAADLVLQACDAIREAHGAGIVHRDLKPANLFLTRRANGSPLVKVLDFGISKAKSQGEAAPSSMTHTHTMLGSPYYMAPEQMVSSRDVDASADIWAIGVILYQLVTGQVPFMADTIGGLVLKVHNEKPPPLPPLHLQNAPGYCALVARCMQLDRAGRPTIDEVVAELTRVSEGKKPSVNPLAMTAAATDVVVPPAPSVPKAPAPAMSTSTGASWGAASGATTSPAPRSRVLSIAAGAITVLVGGGLALFFGFSRASHPSTATSVAATQPSIATPSAAASAPVPPVVASASPSASDSPSASGAAADSASAAVAAVPTAPVSTGKPAARPARPVPAAHAATAAPANTMGSAFDR
jgi:serine/threonine protein kinase